MYEDMLSRLLEGRARETGELQTFFKEAEKRADTTGKLTGEDQAEWEKRTASLDEYDTRLKQIRDQAEGDKQADEFRSDAEKFLRPRGLEGEQGDPKWAEQEKRTLDFFSATADDIKNHKGPNTLELDLRGLQIERQGNRNIVRETRGLRNLAPMIESRAGLDVGTGSAGGDLFGPSFRTVLYQHLIFNAAMRQTRATVLTTASGENLLLPKTVTHPLQSGGSVTAEAGTITESDPVFGQGTLGAYKYADLILVSSELEQDVQVDLLGYLAMAMGRALGNVSGTDYVTGSGVSKPTGVLVGAGTVAQVVGGTPAASGPTFSELTQLYDKIIPPYQMNAEWFFGQSTMQKIRALTNSQGTPIFLPSLYGAEPDTLFGKPIILDPNMPTPASNATIIAFGDFAAYFIRDVAGLRFERSIDFAFNTDQIAYRAILRTDAELLDTTGAIGTYKGGTA